MTESIKFTVATNPASGEELGRYPLHDADYVKEIVPRMREAQRQWEATPWRKRKRHFRLMQKYLASHSMRMARELSRDNGKTVADAYLTEIMHGIIGLDYYMRHTPRVLRPRRFRGSHIFGLYKSHKVYRRPFGVVGIISPWNYPFAIPFTEIIMGLAAGNAILFKGASQTQHTAHLIQEVIGAGELPQDLFVMVNLPGRETGPAFLGAGVDKIFFTGSVRVGKELMRLAAQTLTPLSLELGGNDAMIVCEDADLERAAYGAIWAGLQNAGQSCGAVERVYVHESVYDKFLKLLTSKLEQLTAGDPAAPEVDIGCLTTKEQLETVQAHLQDALAKGAKIQAKSQLRAGANLAMEVVVLTNVNHEMLVMREETFGPLLPVMPYRTDEEALQLANDGPLGLTASVWTRSKRRGLKLAAELQAGVVTVNDHLMTHGMPNLPWGGMKESGIGRTHGELGLLEMTEAQAVVWDFWPLKKIPYWLPLDQSTFHRWVGLGELIGGDWKRKIRGVFRILTAR